MNLRNTLTLVGLPALAAGYVLFHPGIAFAATPLATKLPPTHLLQGGDMMVDPVHTFVGFDIGHLGLSRVQGRFDTLTGALRFDPKDPSKDSVHVTVQTASVDTNVAPRDADLKSPNFFDVEKYPELTFESTRIRKKGKSFIAEGNLTIKGVTQKVSIPFKEYGPIKDPWGSPRIGVVADAIKIHRSDFGITSDPGLISDDVVVRISLEAAVAKAQ